MLTHDRLLELHRELGDAPALSVYVDGNQHDPAERKKWRLQLEQGLAEARSTLSDAELAKGDLPRAEVEEGISQLKKTTEPWGAC